LRVFKKLGYLSYFFSTVCKIGPFCFLVLHFFFVFVVVIVVSQVDLCYIRFSAVFFIIVISVCFDFFVTGYVFNLFGRYLISDSLCSYGWYKLLGIMMPVCIRFLYIENSKLFSLQCILMSI
jgi:hypothetical protein